MTEPLIYNTPNSEEILRNIYTFEIQRNWKKNLAKNNKNLFWSIVFILLAAFLFIYRQSIAYFFAGLALMYIIIFINYRIAYKRHKKKMSDLLEEEIKNFRQNPKDVIWEFTPDYFRFRNYKHDFKFAWEGITYCVLEQIPLHNRYTLSEFHPGQRSNE